jgi:cell division protein FtsA
LPEKNKLFALDIGTRSVVGIVLEEVMDQFEVIDILTKEHSERAMLDGQIHDVLAVSKVITEIKSALEKKHGQLKKVCVAAAGRSLKTERAKVTVNIQGKPMLQKQDILHLELSAVQQAQALVAEAHTVHMSHYYYCVGYSVLYYRLDGEEIGNLIDQQGEEASVEIIATFLPRVVVESLISALHRSGLEMEALTLEPIAAINVLIPPSMRRLNVALVDIGAGTSDIAITDMGTVIAYGMVPIAGDEITEAISDQYLLDFPLAENAKRELYAKDSIQIIDILGFESDVPKEDVINEISPSIERLASSICNEILLLNNQKAPKAVMLVGGGSLTPELPERIARLLQLPANRVAIRGIDAISSLTIADQIQKGPELVTPVGIAIAAHKSPVQYLSVYVNEQPVRLFEVNKLTIGDCLLAAGIKMSKLYGKPGLAKIITLNGQALTIPGEQGYPPTLLLNGKTCSWGDEVNNGDQVLVEKGADGGQTDLCITDLIDHIPARTVILNGSTYQVDIQIWCNGHKVSGKKMVEDKDSITFQSPETIEALAQTLYKGDLLFELQPFRLIINGIETSFPSLAGKVYRNGMIVDPEERFAHLDDIQITHKQEITVKEMAEIKQLSLMQRIPITFNGESLYLKKKTHDVVRTNEILKETDPLLDGDTLEIVKKDAEPFIFQDLFNHVEIEMPAKANGHFLLLRNNEHTTFFEKIAPGDDLRIVWPMVQDTNGSEHVK